VPSSGLRSTADPARASCGVRTTVAPEPKLLFPEAWEGRAKTSENLGSDIRTGCDAAYGCLWVANGAGEEELRVSQDIVPDNELFWALWRWELCLTDEGTSTGFG
jgi:hypothetical protein